MTCFCCEVIFINNISPSSSFVEYIVSIGVSFCFTGVPASNKMASNDLAAMDRYKREIFQVATETKFDPAVIAGQAKYLITILLFTND